MSARKLRGNRISQAEWKSGAIAFVVIIRFPRRVLATPKTQHGLRQLLERQRGGQQKQQVRKVRN